MMTLHDECFSVNIMAGLRKATLKVTIRVYMDIYDIDSAYQSALDYLYSFVDFSLTRQLRYSPENFNLIRMVSLMDLLGNPQKNYPVIHVAGTKGKGSTSAMIASVLQHAGYRTGFYTSPHLHDYGERIQIDRVNLSRYDLVELLDEMKSAIKQVDRLTTFEITTALGFLYFSRRKVDIAVIEVGLGGRLDATNIVDPLVSVITSLSMDHMNVLGNTLSLIAREKAGIIKTGRPVVLAPQQPEARLVVEDIAREKSAPLFLVGRDVRFEQTSHTLDGQTFDAWIQSEHDQSSVASSGKEAVSGKYSLRIPLLGYHQLENAATALLAVSQLKQSGLEITKNDIESGFKYVIWEGRFEVLQRFPFVVVDSAHNQDSAKRLRETLDDYLEARDVILVFGASEDKDVSGMLKELLPRISYLIATQSEHPRAMDAGEILAIARDLGLPGEAILPVENAVRNAMHRVASDEIVLISGSIFLAAAGKEIWQTHTSNTADKA